MDNVLKAYRWSTNLVCFGLFSKIGRLKMRRSEDENLKEVSGKRKAESSEQ